MEHIDILTPFQYACVAFLSVSVPALTFAYTMAFTLGGAL